VERDCVAFKDCMKKRGSKKLSLFLFFELMILSRRSRAPRAPGMFNTAQAVLNSGIAALNPNP
jgi:hypothetical protein